MGWDEIVTSLWLLNGLWWLYHDYLLQYLVALVEIQQLSCCKPWKRPKSWMRWNLWMKCWKERLPDTNKSQNHCMFWCMWQRHRRCWLLILLVFSIKCYRFPIRYTFEDPNDFGEHAQNEKNGLPESQTDSSDSSAFGAVSYETQDKDNMKIVPKLIIQTTQKKNGSLGLTSNLQVGSLT